MEIGAGTPAFRLDLLADALGKTDQNGMCKILPHFLRDEIFVNTVIGYNLGRHTAWEEPAGLTILAHWHPREVWSRPHDHGRTWAIYGVATGKTAMWDWELIEPATEGLKGKVKLVRSYWIMPGEVYYYPVGAIHSHHTYDDSRLIRIEGMNIHRKSNSIGGHSFEIIAA